MQLRGSRVPIAPLDGATEALAYLLSALEAVRLCHVPGPWVAFWFWRAL